MGRKFDVIIKNIKRYNKSLFTRSRFYFSKYYDTLPIDDKAILFQSYDGSSISGNPYYMLKEVCSDDYYKNYKKFVVAKHNVYEKTKKFLLDKGYNDVEVVLIHSKEYCKALATSKYLINNSTFAPYFIKKEGQIYLNTWHGTPLKHMGIAINSSQIEIGNSQRNFIMCDYLLYPNRYTFEHMKDGYFLDNLFPGKYLLDGYPRNSVFYDEESRQQIKDELELNDKKIVVYMPTWHGDLSSKSVKKEYIQTMHNLLELDKKLNDDTILYTKLHNFVSSKVEYGLFDHIKPFPDGYETYEFLNVADCLVTDYSSVFFDFSNTGRKIILYAYDKEEYLCDRGLYLDYDKLPFTLVKSTDELVKEIENIDDYEEYEEFREEYNKYDNIDTSKKICDILFKGITKDANIVDGSEYSNGKKNILIFPGALHKNGITTALKGLINNTSRDNFNYILTFYKTHVKNNKDVLNELKNIEFIPIQGNKDMTISEGICHLLYYRFNLNFGFITKKLDKMYAREAKRIYYNLKFDYVIHFSGYEKQVIHLFSQMNGKKVIYTHSDIMQEYKTRNNVHLNSILYAYSHFDNIAIVRDTMKDEIVKNFPKTDPNKIVLMHNINNIERILAGSKEEIAFDEDSFCNKTLDEVTKILNDRKCEKFITVARFSVEKGLDQLVISFKKYQADKPNSYLFIIGSHGPEFNKILDLSADSDNIVIIRPLKNPYAILSKCDLFILSSHYEGLPMTIMEALILNKPILSTDIAGPRKFLSLGYAHLVEDSVDGLVSGMEKYHETKFDDLIKFDAEQFNEQAIREFEDFINGRQQGR